jgi:hypothetical protein
MDPAKEKAALTRLIEEAPNSPHRRDADQMLKELPTAPPPAQPPPAQPPPADQPPQPTPPAQPNR